MAGVIDIINNLNDEQLKECFEEIEQYRKRSVLPKISLIRKVRDEIIKQFSFNDEAWDTDCRIVVIPEILHEISERHYKQEVKSSYKEQILTDLLISCMRTPGVVNKEPKVGDYCIEKSTLNINNEYREDCIGELIGYCDPSGYVIRTLNGKEINWRNAFISRIPDKYLRFRRDTNGNK